MNLEQIKAAVKAGKTVHCGTGAYIVIEDNKGQWMIKCTLNNYCIGLTHQDGVTLNGKEADFFIAKSMTHHAIIGHLQQMSDAMNSLTALWDIRKEECDEILTGEYPFENSFDQVAIDVQRWLRHANGHSTSTPKYVPAVFTIDGGDPFVGVHCPENRWNGWAIPYFTKEEGMRFMTFYNSLDSSITFAYNEAQDAFTSIDDSDPDNTVDTYPAQDIDGVKRYSIGGCYFVWDAEQPKTFFEQDHSGRDGHGELTLIDICSDADNQEEYSCTDEDDRENSIIHWALNAEIGDTYQDGASTYTRTK